MPHIYRERISQVASAQGSRRLSPGRQMLFRTHFHFHWRWKVCLCCHLQYSVACRTLLRGALIERELSGAELLAFVVPLRQIGAVCKLEMQVTRTERQYKLFEWKMTLRRGYVLS
jgi:hypothetical protein